jgi:hypothetical protein
MRGDGISQVISQRIRERPSGSPAQAHDPVMVAAT